MVPSCFRRRAEAGLERQAKALASDQPLWALWEFSTDPAGARITMEFMGLANRNEEFKAEIARYAEMLRAAQLEALPGILDRYGRTAGPLSLEVLTFLLTAISRVMVTEQLIGMSLGHAAILALVHQYLRDLEGDPKTWQPRRLTVSREEKP